MSLFGATPELAAASARRIAPLAERMRPRTLDQYLGQQHLIGPGKPLRMQIESDAVEFLAGVRGSHSCGIPL